MNKEKNEHVRRSVDPAVHSDEKLPNKKTDGGLVVLDNPDDGEIYDTGDASDFAGERNGQAKRSNRSDAGSATLKHPR